MRRCLTAPSAGPAMGGGVRLVRTTLSESEAARDVERTRGVSERKRLFALSFAAVVATSFCFVLRALVVDDWGRVLALDETQEGELLGAGLWRDCQEFCA